MKTTKLIVVGAALISVPATTHGFIYVTNNNDNKIAKYDFDGTPVNASLVTGLNDPRGIALSPDGTSLFVTNFGAGTVGKYEAATGAVINPVLISGLTSPTGVAVHGSNLFVTSLSGFGKVGKYTIDGAPINESLIFGMSFPEGMAVSDDGTKLFVSDLGFDRVGLYDAATGATLNESQVPGLDNPRSVALSDDGSTLFIVNGGGTVGQYDAATGAAVNTSLVSGLSNPFGVALDDSTLFVTEVGESRVGQYTTSGDTVNASFISGFVAGGIALSPDALRGDFDGDFDIDLTDFLFLSAHLLTDVSNLTTQQSLLLGDLTADLRIDGRDFVAFRTAYDEANGVGAFTAMLEAIPEPSTWLLAVFAAVLAWRHC